MPPCSSPPTTAATSPASSCSSMAAWPRYRTIGVSSFFGEHNWFPFSFRRNEN
jgi:hypothetical protein